MDRPQKKDLLSISHWFFESPGLRISQGLLRYRFLILSVLCLLFLGSMYQIFELQADFSLEELILTEDEEGKFFEELRALPQCSGHGAYAGQLDQYAHG